MLPTNSATKKIEQLNSANLADPPFADGTMGMLLLAGAMPLLLCGQELTPHMM